MPSPTPEATPTPTTPLPQPRFSAAPNGTILVVQYRNILSETFSYENPGRPFYHPRDTVTWAIPTKGEPYRWVDDGRDKVEMQLSPDGSQVAYVVNSRDGKLTSIWAANADGSNPRQLTPDYLDDNAGGRVYLARLAWSPDGQKLAYAFNYSKGYKYAALYVVDVFSKQVTKVNLERAYDAEWVGGNSRLLRAFKLTEGYEEIAYDIDIYTLEATPVTSSTTRQVAGRAVVDDLTPGSEKITIYAMDGSKLYQLDLSGWSLLRSTLSPDLKWFVLNIADSDKRPEGIYKVGKDHPQPQLLLQGFEFIFEGEIGRMGMKTNLVLKKAWSPDSLWFLVHNQFDGKGGQELYAVNVETGEIRTVMEFEAAKPDIEGVGPVVWLK
jgi:Tol biopolymer transport system component